MPSSDEFRRGLALRAVEGRGALTEAGIAEHCRFRGGAREVRPHVDALVATGLVRRVEVDDGGAAGRRPGRRRARRRPDRGACSSARSTTCSGTGRSCAGCSASTT